MNKNTILFSFIFLFSFFFKLYSQTDEDNIIVEFKIESYSYKKSSERISVEEKTMTEYRSVKWPEEITIAEFYDLHTTIRNVNVTASRKVKPFYQMYQQSGIFYNDLKVCFINLPFTKKGDKVNVSFEKTYNDILTTNKIFLFEPQFIKQKKIEVTIPDWIDVEIIERNLAENITKEVIFNTKTNATKYIYTIKDQPAVTMLYDAPDYHRTAPYLLLRPKKAIIKNKEITYFNNYDDVYAWCKDKIDYAHNDTAIISAFTQKLISSCSTSNEKIAAMYAWVQNNIRYIAFEYGLASWVPDDAQHVLQKKYGDCKGMANLLKVMLQSAGFDARLSWILTHSSYISTGIPLPLFNHMICVLFHNDEIIYLDPTVKYMGVGEYHDGIQGCATMIEDGENYLIKHVPEITPSQNTDSLYCNYVIDGNALTGKVTMTLHGENKETILSLMNMINSSFRMSAVKQFLENGKSEVKVSDILFRIDSVNNNLVLNYKEVCSGRVNKLNNELYIDLDSRRDFDLAAIDTIKRKQDILLPFKEKIIREEYLTLPVGYEIISLPDDFHIENDNYIFHTRYFMEENKIKYLKEITIKNTWLKKEDFSEWNSNLSLLRNNYSQQIILRESVSNDSNNIKTRDMNL